MLYVLWVSFAQGDQRTLYPRQSQCLVACPQLELSPVFQKGLEKYINTFLNGKGSSLLMNIHFGTVGY